MLALRTGVPRWKMSDVVTHLRKTVKVSSTVARCDACLKQRIAIANRVYGCRIERRIRRVRNWSAHPGVAGRL
jgi:hypothetical protein